MDCEICGNKKVLICNEFRCGRCYEKELLSEKLTKYNAGPTYGLEEVYDTSKHRNVLRKKK
jgi:hypothetical protein